MKIDRWAILISAFAVPSVALFGFWSGEEWPVFTTLAAFGALVWFYCVLVMLSGLVGWALDGQDL